MTGSGPVPDASTAELNALVWWLIDARRGRGAGCRHQTAGLAVDGPGRTCCGIAGRVTPALRGSLLPHCPGCCARIRSPSNPEPPDLIDRRDVSAGPTGRLTPAVSTPAPATTQPTTEGTAMTDTTPNTTPSPVTCLALTGLTLDAIQAEATRAHLRHGPHSLLNPHMADGERLAILMEEVGEVAHALTYDSGSDTSDLQAELIQVAAVAASWVEALATAPAGRSA